MGIRRMIPMGTTQRRCVVCGYPINARSAELTAHEMECIENMTTRTIRDPFTGQDVQLSDRLVDRLRGKYACGPTLPNGEPEFGWQQRETPPIAHEAAARIEALEAALRQIATECSTFPIKDGLAFRCESITYTALTTETEK